MRKVKIISLAALIGITPITSSISKVDLNTIIKKEQNKSLACYQSKQDNVIERVVEIARQESEKREKELQEKKINDKKTKVAQIMSVPSHNSSFKSYMDYKAITNTKSIQYKVNRSSKVYTDSSGMRRVMVGDIQNENIDDFIVALGTFYGKVGDRFVIHFSNGQSITAMVGDLKANKHTDSSNRYHLSDKSVVEFITDNKKLNVSVKRMGDVSYLTYNSNPDFKINGNVAKIEKLVESFV